MWLFMEICQRLRISNEIRIITTFQWGFKNIEINGLFMLISIRIMLLVLLFYLLLVCYVSASSAAALHLFSFIDLTFELSPKWQSRILDIGYRFRFSWKSNRTKAHTIGNPMRKKFMLIDIVNITFPHFCHFIGITSNSPVSLGSVSLLGRKRGKKHKIKSAAKSLCVPHVNHHTIVNICSIKHHTKRKSTRCERHEKEKQRKRERSKHLTQISVE